MKGMWTKAESWRHKFKFLSSAGAYYGNVWKSCLNSLDHNFFMSKMKEVN